MTTVVQAFSTNTYRNLGSFQDASFSAVTSGNSLVLILRVPTAQMPLTTAPETWNGSAAVSMGAPVTSNTDIAGQTRYVYKLDNITDGATQIRWKTSATGQCASDVFELGTAGSALTLDVNQFSTVAGAATQTVNFTSVIASSVSIITLDTSSGPTITPIAPYLLATHGNYNVDTIYNANIGATGSKSASWTSSNGNTASAWVLTFSSGVADPTVTTVTSNSATEGSAIVHTVTLSAATTDVTNYAATLVGVNAIAGTDFTSDLASATYSNGVTFSGGNIVVPTAVSSFTVSIPTTQDTLDEVDETYTLTIGGVASTGTILDNDPVVSYITANVASSVNAGAPLVVNYNIRPISGKDITAELTLTPDTAIAGTHYTTPVTSGMFNNSVTISGSTVTIPAGTSNFTLTIPTIL